jgi:nicotinamide riboside transporter PnuC
MWSWVLAVIGVAGIYFVGRKKKWAWLWLIFNECLWIIYAVATNQYGFIFAAVAYTLVYIKSFLSWKKEDPKSKPVDNTLFENQVDFE